MTTDARPAHGEAPDQVALTALLGGTIAQWDALVTWLIELIGAHGSWARDGEPSGWELRFKRGGRPLVTLTPRSGGFRALVVLGQEEVRRAATLRLGDRARRTFDEARQYHDGRWLFLSVADDTDLADVMSLMTEKLPVRLRASLEAAAAANGAA